WIFAGRFRNVPASKWIPSRAFACSCIRIPCRSRKRSLSIVDECSDDFERKLGLADAVFSFAASPLIRVLGQLHLLGGGMAVRHRRKLPTCSSSRRSIFDQHQRSIPA